MEVSRIKLIIAISFLAFCSHAQITKTEEVRSNFDRDIAHLKEIFRTEMNAIAKALEIKTDQDEIHFEKLNGEARQLKEMQQTYFLKEAFTAYEKSTSEKMEAQDKKIQSLEAWKNTQEGKMIAYAAVVGLVLFGLNYYQKRAQESKRTKEQTT